VAAQDWTAVWRGPYADGLAQLPGSPRVDVSVAAAAEGGAAIDAVDEITWDDEAVALEGIKTPAMRYLLERLGALEEPGWPQGGLTQAPRLLATHALGPGV